MVPRESRRIATHATRLGTRSPSYSSRRLESCQLEERKNEERKEPNMVAPAIQNMILSLGAMQVRADPRSLAGALYKRTGGHW